MYNGICRYAKFVSVQESYAVCLLTSESVPQTDFVTVPEPVRPFNFKFVDISRLPRAGAVAFIFSTSN